ncbi:MAG: hypothetical protein ACTHK6_07505 [Solirubrobacterales bacterium]
MKRVYLDQNKWIDLARAVNDVKDGDRFADARLVLEEGVNAGHVSIPLSSAHYMETQNRRDWRSRRQLAETMIAFSKLQTVAPPDAILPAEIDVALKSLFGVLRRPRELRVFGVGVSHAFNMPVDPYRIPEELRGNVSDPDDFERRANEFQERYLLIGPSPEMEEEGIPDYDPFAHLQVGERYAKAKEKLRDLRKGDGWHKGERSQRIAMAQALTDNLPQIEEAMSRAGLQIDLLIESGRRSMADFVSAVPTMLASSELEKLRHASSQKPWERQDLNDIAALSVAIAHCDVVVTERLWADAARRANLGEKLGTIVIARLDELPERLLAVG